MNLKQMIEGFLMLREGLNKTKKKIGFIHIWVGRWFRMGTKSTKKTMPLKSILDHFKSFKTIFFYPF